MNLQGISNTCYQNHSSEDDWALFNLCSEVSVQILILIYDNESKRYTAMCEILIATYVWYKIIGFIFSRISFHQFLSKNLRIFAVYTTENEFPFHRALSQKPAPNCDQISILVFLIVISTSLSSYICWINNQTAGSTLCPTSVIKHLFPLLPLNTALIS